MEDIRIISSAKSWIEGDALEQLRQTMRLPGMRRAVGLPDLHPGKGHPIGAAFASEGRIYPFLIGADIGCGIGLWPTGLKASKAKRDQWAKRLRALAEPWEGDAAEWLARHGVASPSWLDSVGTIGGGNHFAELQAFDEVADEAALAALGLAPGQLVLLVHSGSRGLGDEILRSHTSTHGAAGVPEDGPEARRYLALHDDAVRWAAANRALIAARFLDVIGGDVDAAPVLDLCHNSMTSCCVNGAHCWLHRKGAAPSDQGALVIPGSRGSHSYLVQPVGDQSGNLWSLAHGAGRKWNRSAIRARLKGTVDVEALRQTRLGSVVICDDKDLLFEEAPEAYKNIDAVIDDMAAPGLLQVLGRLKPVITFKSAEG
jgi:release factor H-coupled RctB family protein